MSDILSVLYQNVSIYVSMYHLLRVCRTLVPEIRVCPEMLRVFRYINVITCVIYNCTDPRTTWTTGATRVCREDYRWRQVGECADTWYKQIQLPGNLPTRLCESKTTDELTVLLFCDIHIDIGATLNLLQWLTVLRHHWHCCICSYCHNISTQARPRYSLNALVIVLATWSCMNNDYDYTYNNTCIIIWHQLPIIMFSYDVILVVVIIELECRQQHE